MTKRSNLSLIALVVGGMLLIVACQGTASGQDNPVEASSENENAMDQDAQTPLRDLNSYFPLVVPESLGEWENQKTNRRKHLLVSLGLWPMPPAPDSTPTIHGLIDQGDYTIEKVYFESLPGFLVTGNLYRPKNATGKIPGILCPHGHHRDGRFLKVSEKEIDGQLAQGAESFRSNARSVLQARCANLARMGCVVFHYDMIGYADSQQLSHSLIHGFSKQRPAMSGSERWGLFSPQAELNLQSAMGLQTLNSIRALDFLTSLPDVDPDRIGVTGCSGGGTQTFILCAIDDRPAAAFPAVMVSTAMQGGCTCENCSYLRVGTGNVEFAAMFAPKPMGLTTANDWTKEMVTKGFPELKQIYELYDKRDNVQLTSRIEFGHNYNQVSREAMYRWFKQHLRFDGDPVETEIEFVDPALLTVFDDDHPRPRGGAEFEARLLRYLALNSQMRMLMSLDQSDATDHDLENDVGTFVDVVCAAAEFSVGAIEDATETKETVESSISKTQFQFENGWVSSLTRFGPTDVALFQIGEFQLTKGGRDTAIFGESLDGREPIAVGNAIFRNESLTDTDRVHTRRVNNSREALSYTTGYNAPQLAKRAHAWASVVHLEQGGRFIVASGRSTLEVALNAKKLRSEKNIKGLIVRTDGIRFASIDNIRDPNLLPGAVKYLDLPGMLALVAPKPMLLIGEDKESAKLILRAYQMAGKTENLTLVPTNTGKDRVRSIVHDWIKSQIK